MRGNTITLNLAKGSIARAGGLFQYDYGQRLILEGVELPFSYEVHFSNKERGESKTSLGDSTGVDIPDEYLQSGENIHVWLYLHNTENDGETEYHGIISVQKRAKPKNQAPTPVQQDVITQTLAALDAAVDEAEGIAEAIPETVNTALQEAKDSGEFDGFSPVANVVKEGHVATITITDKEGTTTATVEDGSSVIIDDNAGAGVKDKTWSADKITQAIGDINSFDIEIVQTLPVTGKDHTIYFVPKQGGTGDSYDEYLYLNGQWEMIGTTDVDVSNKADKTDTVLLTTLSRGRKSGTTVGTNSFAFGNDVTASANNAFAEGYNTRATGASAHAEGGSTTASGQNSHAEGESTAATNTRAHAEGYLTTASGAYSHAEGYGAVNKGALGKADHAEGYQTTANSGSGANVYGAHAEGVGTTASNHGAHAEGGGSVASGSSAHAEGGSTVASGHQSHSEGGGTTASGGTAHAEGGGTQATGTAAHAEGSATQALGNASHAEGYMTKASANAHSEGYNTTASGSNSHSEGESTTASALDAHAEGFNTQATGQRSHAEGVSTTASGDGSHSEGTGTTASSDNAHAEGYHTEASGIHAHAEGYYTVASGAYSHAEGYYTEAVQHYSHVSGIYNVPDLIDYPTWEAGTHYYVGDKTKRFVQMSGGYIAIINYNCTVENTDTTFNSSHWQQTTAPTAHIFIVGVGTNASNKRNGFALDRNGNASFRGDAYVGCENDSSGGSKLISEANIATTTETQAIITDYGVSA